jgi:hypothetical protein
MRICHIIEAAGINQMVQSRRLILHIGAPKTGTSAIQRFLASNIENLRLIGMDYLNAEPPRADFHTTGNGLPIFLYFERAEAEPNCGALSRVSQIKGSQTELRSSTHKLKPLPPDPLRHQGSAIAPASVANDGVPSAIPF